MSHVRSALLTCLALALPGIAAQTATAADDPGPGPALSVTSAQLDQAFECSGPLTGLTRDPVLLTPAFSTADQSYGWNYRRQLPAVGITTCSLTVPDKGFGDLQATAEYVVAAVRRMSAASGGGKVALLGHQHGALDELWALRFWPDVAGKVSDYISLATPYHGTTTVSCNASKPCAPALWQIARNSKFLAALGSAPLPAGPSYTSISTAYDELIMPQPSTSLLAGATNIVIQSVCPLRPIEHFTILGDAITYRLVLDALGHDGPAVASHISKLGCLGPLYMPGILTLPGISRTLSAGASTFAAAIAQGSTTGPGKSVPAEPAVRDYALAG